MSSVVCAPSHSPLTFLRSEERSSWELGLRGKLRGPHLEKLSQLADAIGSFEVAMKFEVAIEYTLRLWPATLGRRLGLR